MLNAKNNVMLVHKHQIFVYLVTELIGLHGIHLIMIARKHNFIYYLDALLVTSIII